MESIVIDPDIMSGTPVFKGTRVPVKTMLDYLLSGVSAMQDFLEDYPSVSVVDAKQVLSALGSRLLDTGSHGTVREGQKKDSQVRTMSQRAT